MLFLSGATNYAKDVSAQTWMSLSLNYAHSPGNIYDDDMTCHRTVYDELGIDVSNGVTATNCVYVYRYLIVRCSNEW